MADNLLFENEAIILGNVFALTQDMTIKGRINDVFALSQNFTLSKSGVIVRNLNLCCSTAIFEGSVKKSVNLTANSFTFAENALNVIGEDFNYSAEEEAFIPKGIVGGEINFSKITSNENENSVFLNYVFTLFMVALYSVIVIILATHIAPNFANKATYCMTKKTFVTLLIGILAFFIIPIVSILALLLFSGVFVYASFALIAIYLLVLSITISILGIAIGNYFASKLKVNTKSKLILLSIASVVVLWLLQQLPIIGTYISIFTVIFGLGILLYSLFSKKIVIDNN